MTVNKQDREQVAVIQAKLEDLKAQIEAAGQELQALADAEQEKFDNLNEGLQQSEQGQAIEAAAETLGEAASACENGEVGEAIEQLGNL